MSRQNAQDQALRSGEETTTISQKRQYWRDPATHVWREIWQPGDGDGDLESDSFDKPGPLVGLDKRWRLYLSTLDTVESGITEPPKYVVLDDKAAYQVHASGISKLKIARFWSHDFAGKGGIRTHRVHRGNPAIADAAVDGLERYGWAPQGKHKRKYHFHGEKDFKPMDSITEDSATQRGQA